MRKNEKNIKQEMSEAHWNATNYQTMQYTVFMDKMGKIWTSEQTAGDNFVPIGFYNGDIIRIIYYNNQCININGDLLKIQDEYKEMIDFIFEQLFNEQQNIYDDTMNANLSIQTEELEL